MRIRDWSSDVCSSDLEMLAALQTAAARQGAVLKILDRDSDRHAVVRLVERSAVEQALTPDTAQEIARWSGRGRGAPEGVPAANVPAEPRPDERRAGKEGVSQCKSRGSRVP